ARAINRQLGLESTLGAVNLAGGYAVQEEYLTRKMNTVLNLQLGWKFTPLSQIITSFKQSLAIDTSLLATDTYSLSLTHRVGSLFDLALSGVVTTYEKDGVLQPIKDYKAEARLGVRF